MIFVSDRFTPDMMVNGGNAVLSESELQYLPDLKYAKSLIYDNTVADVLKEMYDITFPLQLTDFKLGKNMVLYVLIPRSTGKTFKEVKEGGFRVFKVVGI